MNRLRLFTLITVVLSGLLAACGNAPAEPSAATEDSSSTVMEATTPESLLRHVVVFKYKEEATPADIEKVTQAFMALQEAIPEIHDFEWGVNNSPENLNQGFTHCYLLTFKSEADRDIYLPHPAHKEFGALIGPYLEQAFVVDYWTK